MHRGHWIQMTDWIATRVVNLELKQLQFNKKVNKVSSDDY